MATAQSNAPLTQYPSEDLRVGRGILISVGIHLFLATLVCLILYLLGIVSLKDLLSKGGRIAENGPAPEPMVVELKIIDIKPPPTDYIEFAKEILKPKPVVIPPKPPPKPVPKPIVKIVPRYTAPKATGSGQSLAVSTFQKGSSGFPIPSYPEAQKEAGEAGTVHMHVVFDAGGRVVSAEVTSSSGVSELDSWTRNFIYAHWGNPVVANQSVNVPIVYDLSGRVH